MDKWIAVVTNPLGIVGFVLFLVFTFVGKSRRPFDRNVFLGLAAVALIAGLTIAYRQAPESAQPGLKPVVVQPAENPQPAAQTKPTAPEVNIPPTVSTEIKQDAKADHRGTAINIGGNVIQNERQEKK